MKRFARKELVFNTVVLLGITLKVQQMSVYQQHYLKVYYRRMKMENMIMSISFLNNKSGLIIGLVKPMKRYICNSEGACRIKKIKRSTPFLSHKRSIFTTSKMDRKILRQKVRQRISVLEKCFQRIGILIHVLS